MTKHLTELLTARTEAIRQFRIAFRNGGPADSFRAEIFELNRRIRDAEKRLAR